MPGGACSSRPLLTKHEDKLGLVAKDEGQLVRYRLMEQWDSGRNSLHFRRTAS